MFRFIPLLNDINTIEGWLDVGEADLLICAALKICTTTDSLQTIVEVGSYHGKSTVLLGSVIKWFSPASKVYAIDPHNGVVGAREQGFQAYPPSLSTFKANIERAGLADIVEAIVDHSYNVKWEKPISFLFIDGLHDYENVSRDFNHFEAYLMAGSLVAFHDYRDQFPGVKKFVDELLDTGRYIKLDMAQSLVVLQKGKE